MSNNPLVPTQIVNKNGVLTTVHKKVDLGSGVRAMQLPVPALKLKADPEARVRIANALSRADGRHNYAQYGVSNMESLEYRLDKYTPEVIAAYDKAITEHPGEGFEGLLVSALHKRVSPQKAGFLLFIAQHDDEQESDWDPDEQYSYSYEHALEIYNGIKSLKGEFDFDTDDDVYGSDDEHSVNVISALIAVTNKVHNADDGGIVYVALPDYGYTLNNDSLIQLIVRRPEDADRIAEIVIARKNPEAAVIEEVLDSEVPALSDGLI